MNGSVDALVGNPLSLDQLRLWRALLDCPAQSFRSYGVVKAAGALTLPRLRDAFEAAAGDSELLRSRLVSIPGMVYPVLMSGAAASVTYHDYGRLDESEDAAVDRMARALASVRFSLEESPLIEVGFGRLHDGAVLWGLAAPAFLADGPSVEVLLKKVSLAALVAVSASEPAAESSVSASAPISYAAVCRWRERLLESEEAAAGKRVWEERLAACERAVPDTILPPARGERSTHPSAQSPAVARIATRIPADLAARIAGRDDAASASGFFAAWYCLLWKVAGCPAAPVHVAARCDGRSVPDLADAIGPLERFLPIAATVDPRGTFQTLRDELAEQLAQAIEWQDCFSWPAFDDAAPAAAAKMRSFDYCFEYTRGFAEPATTLALMRRHARSEQYALGLDVLDLRERGCEIALHHDPRSLSPAQASVLLRTYRGFLEQVAGRETIRLDALAWRGAAAAESFGIEPAAGESAGAPAPRVEYVVDRFRRAAAQSPDRVALAEEGRALSYARMRERTDALARTIRDRAPAAESCIAMVGGLSFETILGLVAILKAGHYFVYIDPEHPPARSANALRECDARLILHDAGTAASRARTLAELLDLSQASVIGVDDGSDVREPAHGVDRQPAPRDAGGWRDEAAGLHPDQLVYVTYTSGSTGEPNGVMISHESMARQMEWLAGSFGFTPDDAWLLKTPLGFDASIWEWMTPLCIGATLVFGGQKLHVDPERIANRIRDHRVTVLQAVPSLLRIMADETSPEDVRSLRYLFAGGEALPPDLCQVMTRRCDARLINLYGPTETTINATSWEAPRPMAPAADTSIGRPVDGMRASVADALGQPLPPGFIGELCLMGTGLARGYARRPHVTAARFVPVMHGDGERMYRTGDLVSRDDDGQLWYWGRRDTQVKLRGYRVELGEIEALLASHPGVKTAAACVCAIEHAEHADHAQLVAYVVPSDRAARPDPAELREYLRTRVPDYMAPASVVILDDLPLRPSGKVDRKMLASPDFVDLHHASAYAAPQTTTETALCAIWRRILEVDTVGIGDDFLKLGGQSLLVTRLVGHVRDALGVDISPRLVFDFPVLRDFAAQIDRLPSRAV